jgi:hypothetical protein
MNLGLADKYDILTGASRGSGFACAGALTRESGVAARESAALETVAHWLRRVVVDGGQRSGLS